jgi:hypothetical protein
MQNVQIGFLRWVGWLAVMKNERKHLFPRWESKLRPQWSFGLGLCMVICLRKSWFELQCVSINHALESCYCLHTHTHTHTHTCKSTWTVQACTSHVRPSEVKAVSQAQCFGKQELTIQLWNSLVSCCLSFREAEVKNRLVRSRGIHPPCQGCPGSGPTIIYLFLRSSVACGVKYLKWIILILNGFISGNNCGPLNDFSIMLVIVCNVLGP